MTKVDELEKRIKYLEENYKHNVYLLERYVSLFVIKVQKKYGVTLNKEGFEFMYSNDNPFREEINIEMTK